MGTERTDDDDYEYGDDDDDDDDDGDDDDDDDDGDDDYDDDDDNVGGGGNGWGVDDDDNDDDFDNLQWGTKVLRHFRKMAPFCIVDIPIPFPCLPRLLPPKVNDVFWTLKSFCYFRQHWFGWWGDLRCLKGMK